MDSLKETTTTDSSNNISPKKSPKPTTFFEEEDKENYDYHQEIQADNIYNNHSSNNLVSQELQQLTSTPAGTKLKSNIQLRSDFEVEFPEGCFFGLGKHKDGAEISKFFLRHFVRFCDILEKCCVFLICRYFISNSQNYFGRRVIYVLPLDCQGFRRAGFGFKIRNFNLGIKR